MVKKRSKYFFRHNSNPFGKLLPDCAIRAIATGLNMPYTEVCKRLGVSWKTGHGLIRNSGIFLESIRDAFSEYFDYVQDVDDIKSFNAQNEMLKDLMKDREFNVELMDLDDEIRGDDEELTLERFIDEYEGQGSFLVGLHNLNGEGHIVCCFLSRNPPIFCDTWDCSNLIVDCIMRIKKRLPKQQ
jgi:hypothetical protein